MQLNSRRHVFGDHRGHRNMEATAEISSEVGTCGTVKVFSNSAHTWCEGRIEKQTKDRVKVAYQLPRAHAKEWITKEFVIGNTDLQAEGAGSRLDLDAVDRQSQVPTARRSRVKTPRAAPLLALDTERPSRSPQGFQGTRLPRYWTEEEQFLYDDLFSKFGRPWCEMVEVGHRDVHSREVAVQCVLFSGLKRPLTGALLFSLGLPWCLLAARVTNVRRV